jgi:Cap4, dsDNA endonuclease domain
MSLAKRFVEHPRREIGGSLAQERFDYQALWGLALVFSNHEKSDDYAITFEFHDDIVLLDSAEAPTSVHFYQVKTKDKGHWTLTDLFRRPTLEKDQKEEDRPLSFIGKLFSNYEAFPDDTVAMSFVSNIPLEFAGANQDIAFKDCGDDTFAKFLKRLQTERGSATKDQAGLMHFVKADLSLYDASTHAKGKLNNFVVKAHGEVAYNLDGLYRAVIEDCRTRSKYTGGINSFEDLIRYKAICRADVAKWLAAVGAHAPGWSEIAADLTYDAMKKIRLRAEWMKYRAKALDAGDEGIRSARRDIRAALAPVAEDSLSLTDLADTVLAKVKPTAVKHLSPCPDDRLIAMILYEVVHYGETRKFQNLDKKPSDQAV